MDSYIDEQSASEQLQGDTLKDWIITDDITYDFTVVGEKGEMLLILMVIFNALNLWN